MKFYSNFLRILTLNGITGLRYIAIVVGIDKFRVSSGESELRGRHFSCSSECWSAGLMICQESSPSPL